MKRYIINNIFPLLMGFCIGFVFKTILDIIESIIIKIALIING